MADSEQLDPVDEQIMHGQMADADQDTTLNLTVYPDDPPKSGEWVDIDEVLANPTEEELEAGRRLGETIDPDNDEDAGDV